MEVCGVLLLWILYGCGHWTGALSGRDYSLLWNTNDCLLSLISSSSLTPHSPLLSISPSSVHFSRSFAPFVTRCSTLPQSSPQNQLFSLFLPTSLPPHEVKHSIIAHNQTQLRTYTTQTSVLSPALLSSSTCSHSLTHPVVFFNGSFCPFHLLENKGFLWTQERGKAMDGESDREEEILTLSVLFNKWKKSFYIRIYQYYCQKGWYTSQRLFWL